MGCINKNLKDNQRLIQDFSETRVNQLFDEYFPNENPSYGEFISNPKVKEALGIIPISKVKSEIGKAFGKEISSRELKILKKSISDINDKLLGHSYKLFNIKQKGESDNYSWGLRKINSNINIQAKIDRLKQRINTGKQIRNLEDNQFNFPDINQTIKPGVQELFDSNPELATIGTQEQYSQYLNTIFPNSKVKDIVYHGSNQKINQFEVKKEPLIHFGSKNAALQRGDVLNQVLLNVKDLQTIKDGMWFLGTDEGGLLKELLNRNILTIEEVKNINDAKNKAIQQSPYFHENYRMALPEGEKAGNKKLQEILRGKNIGFEYINLSEDKGSTSYAVPSQEQIHILGGKQDVEGFKEFVQGKQFQKLTAEEKARTIEQVTKKHRSITALKDLSAKLAHRIGGNVRFDNRTDADWKGYNQGNTSVLNEAYMTPDTPFHEILAHPIIRALKYSKKIGGTINLDGTLDKSTAKAEFSKIYQNLLKELETGRGKEVFEQVKRDYIRKENVNPFNKVNPHDITEQYILDNREGFKTFFLGNNQIYEQSEGKWRVYVNDKGDIKKNLTAKELSQFIYDNSTPFDTVEVFNDEIGKYTLEEQQEEAIVTLLGMLAADKLDKIKDKNLISLLKELLLQMSEYIKSLFTAKEIRISELNVSNLEFLTNKKIEDLIKSDKIKKEC